ncbi:MAG: hypothetical protein C5S49_01730 [Candidatus Methanogaster sp.]|nr:MAG: hypothetical protein C5S49_01730 [ANME-2 cluster archaeon]
MQQIIVEFFWLHPRVIVVVDGCPLVVIGTSLVILPNMRVLLQLQQLIAWMKDHTGQARVPVLKLQPRESISTPPTGTTHTQQ